MNRVMHITVVNKISPIIARQLDLLTQTEVVELTTESLEIKSNDSVLIRGMKESLIATREKQDKELGVHGAAIIQSSLTTEQQLLNEMRQLRKKADELQAKAKAQYNARTHLLKSGDILPIASELQLIPVSHLSLAKKFMEDNPVPDYFSEHKKAKGNK